MSGRTVALRLPDGSVRTVPEPTWCVGHAETRLEALTDLVHESPEAPLTVQTSRGSVEVLSALIEQRPFSAVVGRGVTGSVRLGNDWHPIAPEGLHTLADALTGYAGRLRALARDLAELQHEAGRGPRP